MSLLLLLLCGFYGGYRALRLAITDDEVDMLNCIHQTGYAHLFWAENWNAQAQFLNALLAKPCVELLPLSEITANRLPSLVGLTLFLWGVWRIGLMFPTGTARALVTLALVSNAFLLDFFSVSRGYGLAVGLTVLSLSCLLQASALTTTGDVYARRQAATSLWLGFGAALSNMAFGYFYAALLAGIFWLCWSRGVKIRWWASTVLLGVFYVPRVLVAPSQNLFRYGGNIGFVHDTVGSLVRSSFYDRSVSAGLVRLVSGVLALLVSLLAYWSYRQRIHRAFITGVLCILVAILSTVANKLWGIRYPVERAALYLVPLVVLMIAVVAAWSPVRWLRVSLWGLVLVFAAIGLQGVNLDHTLTWRECADIPSALFALREVHQRTGQDVTVGISRSMWTIRYYAKHLLGLQQSSPQLSENQVSFLRNYDWLTIYEWGVLQTSCGLPPSDPLIPGTTHLLLSLLDQDDRRLLATPLPEGLTRLHFYPASDTTLEMLITPQHQGTLTFPDGQKYVGEFKRGIKSGRGAYTWPDGQKYEGEFKDNRANGQGTGTWPDGRRYVGGYRDGKPNGQGTGTWPDGRKYIGEFRYGQPDGTGRMTYPDGTVEDGLWKQGQFVGPALP
ncbi:MAG TPA: hypothetical protein VL486_05845 [Verrucomicrobiae bacterium]|nr:hypothetical protein [Verrucomicrobiae bacterium]